MTLHRSRSALGTRTVLVVAAHPDDDCFIAGGLVAMHAADPGMRFVLVHATCGEAGSTAAGFPLPGSAALAETRVREVARSWQVLGRRPDRHEWLGFADGRLAERVDELSAAIATIIADERPDVVVTFGPDGLTGHPDHAAISAATTAAFEARLAGSGRPHRLVQAAIPQGQLDFWFDRLVSNGWTLTPEHRNSLTGVPDEKIGLVVDCAPVVGQVTDALAEHRSQAHIFRRIPEPFLRARLSTLYGVIAAGCPGRGGVLTDLFEDLDRTPELVR
jgi:LmbE family N-acetylglucosaminyl deacetylase